MDSHKWASSCLEILHHHLAKPVTGVIHLIIEDPAQPVVVSYVAKQSINWLGLNIAKNTLTVEKGWFVRINMTVGHCCCKLCEVGEITTCKKIFVSIGHGIIIF